MLSATWPGVTPSNDHEIGRSPGNGMDDSRIGDSDTRATARGDSTVEQGAARRTFARRIDCCMDERAGSTSRGGRRQPSRGRGGLPGPGGHAA